MDGEDKQTSVVEAMRGQEETNGKARQRKSQSQRQKPQQQQAEEDTRAAGDAISPELARWVRRCAQDLKIRQDDRRWAAELVNDFRDSLLKFLKSNDDQPYFQTADFFNSGSYFEMVKVHSPNEFDMMLRLQPPSRLKMTMLDNGLFYQIDFSRPPRSSIRAFLLENERTLSASKILSETHRLVRKFIKTYKVSDERCRWVVNRKRPNSPAVTLSLFLSDNNSEELISVDVVPALEVHSSQGSPLAARNGPDVDNWLGKKTRQEIKSLACFFVPKRLKGHNLSEAAKESWRISFSHIEKKIIRAHGNKKTCCESTATRCCRKQCFKLLKCLIEGLKQRFPQQLDGLCSYHGKTVFLHTLSIRFKDSMWARHQLPACFLHLLGALEGHTRSGLLPHFFVPDCNLFSPAAFPRRALPFLIRVLEEQRREGLPLLKPPAPVPPLAQHASLMGPVASSATSANSSLPFSQLQSSPETNVHALNIGFMIKIMLSFAMVLISVLFFVYGTI